MTNRFRQFFACIATSFIITTFAAQESLDTIAERIQPIGRVHLASAADTTSGGASATHPTRPSKEIYEHNCTLCHAAGVAGAPKFQNATDWGPRKAKGIDKLLESALKGLNAMPVKGNCADCSNEELKSTIEYMLPK